VSSVKPKMRPHRNGRGLVSDFIEIARQVRVEPPAQVSEQAEVSGSGLIAGFSEIKGNAILSDGPTIHDSIVDGYCIISGTPYIHDSFVAEHALITGDVSITGSAIGGTARVKDNAIINKSIVDGNALVAKNALVQNSHLHGQSVVLGGEVHGVNLERTERVHEGIWYRNPKHMAHPSVPMAMTECIDNKVIIGCLCRSVPWWKQNAERMQEEYGWPDEAVKWIWANIDTMHQQNEEEETETTSVLTHLHSMR
jgi:carbonic anhydrase/acetyltransferase-like protein (isoleucine patch superfamily)